MTLENLFKLASEANVDRSWIHGRLGRLAADGTTVVYEVSYRDNYVWVRMGPNGDQGIQAAYNKGGVPFRAGLPVRMRRDNGVLTIYEVDSSLLSVDPNAPVAPGGVAIHHHRSVAGDPAAANPLSFVLEAKQLDRGRVISAGGMLVTIAAFRYYYNGVWETWEGGNLDLTAYKPGTAGHHAWVLVGIDPSTNTAVAVTGSSVIYATALAYADLDAIAFGGYIPCAAVDVRDDDTALTDITDYVDAHGWFGDFQPPAEQIAAAIHAATLDATPLDADEVPGLDSSASFGLVRWTWTAIKAFFKMYFDGIYLVLAGVAGGQTAYGGTGAGDDLTLRSTSHATKGDVLIADDGGNVGVGTNTTGIATYTMPFVVESAAALGTFIGLRNTEDTHGMGGVWMKPKTANAGWLFGTNNDGVAVILYGSGANEAAALTAAKDGSVGMKLSTGGHVGFGISPQGPLHVHDGTGGMLKRSFTLRTFASAVEVLPNGTGDVLYQLSGTARVRSSSGAVTVTTINVTPGNQQQLLNEGSGASVLSIRVLDTAGANNGAISLLRTAGALSYIVDLDLDWL